MTTKATEATDGDSDGYYTDDEGDNEDDDSDGYYDDVEGDDDEDDDDDDSNRPRPLGRNTNRPIPLGQFAPRVWELHIYRVPMHWDKTPQCIAKIIPIHWVFCPNVLGQHVPTQWVSNNKPSRWFGTVLDCLICGLIHFWICFSTVPRVWGRLPKTSGTKVVLEHWDNLFKCFATETAPNHTNGFVFHELLDGTKANTNAKKEKQVHIVFHSKNARLANSNV